jgi:hypothetical protein
MNVPFAARQIKMTEHQLDSHLRNLSPEELRYVMALLRYHAGLRAEYLNSGSWGVEKQRGSEIESGVDELVARLRNPPSAPRA